jgi:excisionase family DNA binding protein
VEAARKKTEAAPKTMLSAQELADRWGVDVKTIYTAIRDGQLPAVRLARNVLRISLAVVERIENQGRVEPHGGSHAGSTR